MIYFRKIRFKNFLSTGNAFTEIDFCQNSATLIVGKNGAGKSTMLDALCFVLFGKPFRNINKPSLVNSINRRNCLVEIEFDTGNKSYKIIRGIKPNVFEIYCEGKMLNQDASVRDYQDTLEKSILKLNFKSFTQIVILGSASFTPFMQLSAADRRSIIEDLLDIRIFSSMNGILKEKIQSLRNEITNKKYKIDSTQEKVEVHEQYISNLMQDKKDKISKLREQIKDEEYAINVRNKKIESITNKIEELTGSIKDLNEVKGKSHKLAGIKENLNKTINKIEEEIFFYQKNDDCPTCKQNISVEFKTETIKERESKRVKVEEAVSELEEKRGELETRLAEIKEINDNISVLNRKVDELNSENTGSMKYISSLKEQLDGDDVSENNVREQQNILDGYREDLVELESQLEELIETEHYQKTAALLLKDNGIKTKIIRQYIPVINKLVNKYLSSMDFFVNFNLDESFKETIKSRHRDNFSYSSFSEGEKSRIDMSLMLTWRAIAKLKNSSSTNLLILDEVFDSSLDASGTEDLMKILGILEATNLFVISHKGDVLQDKFENVISFEKVNNFSRMIAA